MGSGPVISHPRDMLQTPKRNQSTSYKYGVITDRYRFDQKKLDQ